jgi:uncharacterized protein YndB with AHSA1/START domain
MRIASDRSYRFAVEPAELWEKIQGVDDFPAWWPWLRRFDASGMTTGDVWRCTVQPPLPYALSFTIAIDEVVPHERVAATIGGEITGSAQLHIAADDDGGCTARLTSQLAPASRFLQAIALVARPVVSMGHDWVLDTGAKQFRQQLTA